MKVRIGNRLKQARETKNFNQAEMAELLGVSSATYSRLERNDTSVSMDQLLSFSKTLDIPIQDFLPEIFSINNHNNENGQVGFVIGDVHYYYYTHDHALKELQDRLEQRENELRELREQLKNKES